MAGTEKMEKEEEDKQREAAIASIPILQSNFKPIGVSHNQISKFQELHRKRLQIKSRSKIQKKLKDKSGKSHGKHSDAKDHEDKSSCTAIEDPSVSTSKSSDIEDTSPLQQDNRAAEFASKRHKLHWGLDTKERWERKANM